MRLQCSLSVRLHYCVVSLFVARIIVWFRALQGLGGYKLWVGDMGHKLE